MPIFPFQHVGVPVGLTNPNDVYQASPFDMSQPQQQQDTGGPYQPQIWQLGGKPEIAVDVPITAVFLGLFIIGAAAHMTIFQINRKRSHKFLMSALLFGKFFYLYTMSNTDQYPGFCMARIVTCIMRIAWVTHAANISLGLAAQIFVAVGVIIIYVINLIFAQRMIRASHPRLGWNPVFSIAFKALYFLVAITIIMLIIVTIQSFFTLSTNTRRIDRDVQLYGATCFAVLSFLPIPMVFALLAIPRSSPLDKFGRGRWRTKIFILLTGATLICFGASYRAGTSWLPPVSLMQPLPAYYHKAAFYIANFGVEILTVYLYAILRVDARFHVPNGASSRKSYGLPISDEEKADIADADDKTLDGKGDRKIVFGSGMITSRIFSEEETFDDHDAAQSSAGTTLHRQSLSAPIKEEEEPSRVSATTLEHQSLPIMAEEKETDMAPSPLTTYVVEKAPPVIA